MKLRGSRRWGRPKRKAEKAAFRFFKVASVPARSEHSGRPALSFAAQCVSH